MCVCVCGSHAQFSQHTFHEKTSPMCLIFSFFFCDLAFWFNSPCIPSNARCHSDFDTLSFAPKWAGLVLLEQAALAAGNVIYYWIYDIDGLETLFAKYRTEIQQVLQSIARAQQQFTTFSSCSLTSVVYASRIFLAAFGFCVSEKNTN